MFPARDGPTTLPRDRIADGARISRALYGSREPRVGLIGGSIGGLTAAVVLRDVGCDVQVYDRSGAALQGRGAGIVVHPMTVRYFVEKKVVELDQISVPANRLRYVDRDGATVFEEHANFRFTAWNTLYRVLRSCLEAERYHLDEAMVAFDQVADGVLVRFASGRVERCDLLVCADGASSTGRALLLPDVKPVYAGYVGWRGTVPECEVTTATRQALDAAITYHLMPNSHILAYPIPAADGSVAVGRRLINFVWYRNVPEGPSLEELLIDRDGTRRDISVPPGAVQQRFIDQMREAAAGLPKPFHEVVMKTTEPFIQPILDIQVPRMAFGRVCLIGDAAFTARPHAAAGTAKAAADAWALADAVREAAGDVVRTLREWEPRQLALGRQLIARVREMGDRSQFYSTWRPEDRSLRFGLWGPGN